MTFNEFWKTYHREDPDEALENPHHLRIHMKNGKKYDAKFPGSMVASAIRISVGVKPDKHGIMTTSEFCNWPDIAQIEVIQSKRKKARCV